MKGSSQECHNLTSYWTLEQGVVHEGPLEQGDGQETDSANPEFMETINAHLLCSYAQVATETSLLIREMWMESTGFFPLQPTDQTNEKPTIRLYYRAILNASGTASTLSHLHNLVKTQLSKSFESTANLHINSQLLVR